MALDESILEHYTRYLVSSGTCASDRALEDYLLGLDMFCRIANGNILETVLDYRSFHWIIEDLAERTEWPGGRLKKPWGSLTIYKTATQCIAFFKWALAFNFTPHKVCLDNPEVGHLFQKGAGKAPEFFDWSDPELQKLINDPNNSLKRRAMYHLLRSTGIRPCEFERLRKSDYQTDILLLSRRKGGRPGFAPIDETARVSMKEYLDCLNWHYDGQWLFPKDDYSGPINAHGLWKMMSNHGKKLGVHFYPYKLRHSLPAELADRGHDALTISEVMGHGDPRTTKIYFHLSKQKIRKIYTPRLAS